ncbi:helix-turn-helix domain-containing protein [Maritalea mediterranea]|uniref:Helix-turn-helix domain-containing protein n=1 Tax=Maritalea mediterranea TaxID=2909667 RepID=A0ABS9EAB1_9HYPH|nr:helix-turn-helix domain-containing protein [Maritalea mediterranea]MCF4099803.1 helix-turn-helix domain-containing protein [Maritalea mediterranea]
MAAVKDPSQIPQYKLLTQQAEALEGARGWKGKSGKMTQVEKILNHIKTAGSISQREAMLDYGVQSFHRRLSDIRERGIKLYPQSKKHPTTGQEYTRYYLNPPADCV